MTRLDSIGNETVATSPMLARIKPNGRSKVNWCGIFKTRVCIVVVRAADSQSGRPGSIPGAATVNQASIVRASKLETPLDLHRYCD